MRISEKKLDFDDVLIRPRRSVTASRKDVKIEREFKFYNSTSTWAGFPLMVSNMVCTGTFAMAKELAKFQAITCLHKFYSLESLFGFYRNLCKEESKHCWLSIGTKPDDLDKLKKLVGEISALRYRDFSCPHLCVDVANGYTDDFVKKCAKIREMVGPCPIIMAGNVATPEMVQELIIHGGVDIVKVGIGPGKFCQTRSVTGVGYPQLSAIIECADAAHGLKNGERRLGLICGDGGCKTSGDICKGFGANADFMMVGTFVSGTDECEGEWEYTPTDKNWFYNNPICCDGIEDGRKYSKQMYDGLPKVKSRLKFYGMSSDHAQIKHYGKKIEYAASEGRVDWVDYKGPVRDIIAEIQGGIRSCCAYIGATSLKDLSKCTEFIRI